MLAMLDSYPNIRYLGVAQQIRLLARLAGRHGSIVMRLPVRERLAYLLNPSERRQHVPGDHTGKARFQSSSVSPVMQRVRDRAYAALSRYQPRFYPGKISFVRAQVVTDFPYDPGGLGWACERRITCIRTRSANAATIDRQLRGQEPVHHWNRGSVA